MERNIYIYIFIMIVVTYAIRVLPLTLIRKRINNKFVRSFLYYVPYVTLAVMTFPAILEATREPIAGALALITGILLAWFGKSLFQISISCCIVVFIIEMLI
ncbi:AzlD domain-containing protein [Tissierella creatinophila]|uniref:Branched-chain amino acid transport protein AzlD n=1 Tax=Tissierella creatinophila DSM 6911 TaxID=1123403 RepID=A0A1U7M7D9_TISCR|nr:AzlD domain-containing protein [Tissierella creatinophila]OLS03195.1 branched-chain amino acid transport protein AzlD [Tissierella creatinophila DSM 6911]